MAKYALVASDDSIYTEKDEARIDFSAGLRDGYRWLRIDEITTDTSTSAEWATSEPTVQTIFADRIERVRTIRDMTTQEINAAKADMSLSMVDQIQWKAIFILLNDVRALQSLPPVNQTQFRNWIEGQM